MTRKIIQIAVSGLERTQFTQCSIVTVALCDDGTVWHLYNEHEGWREQPSIPQEYKCCPNCKTNYDVDVFNVCENCGHKWK